MKWYWNSNPGGGRKSHAWYGVAVSKGPFRFSLLWIRSLYSETVTADELLRRLGGETDSKI